MMLVLSRKIGESILISDDIEIRVLQVHGGRVRLGIDAPKHVSIHRKELIFDADLFPQEWSPGSERQGSDHCISTRG